MQFHLVTSTLCSSNFYFPFVYETRINFIRIFFMFHQKVRVNLVTLYHFLLLFVDLYKKLTHKFVRTISKLFSKTVILKLINKLKSTILQLIVFFDTKKPIICKIVDSVHSYVKFIWETVP